MEKPPVSQPPNRSKNPSQQTKHKTEHPHDGKNPVSPTLTGMKKTIPTIQLLWLFRNVIKCLSKQIIHRHSIYLFPLPPCYYPPNCTLVDFPTTPLGLI